MIDTSLFSLLNKTEKHGIWVICLILLTPIRAIVILTTPFLVGYICQLCGIKSTKRWKLFLALMIVSSISGLALGSTYLPNVILSLYIVLPIIYVLMGKFAIPSIKVLAFREFFLNCSIKILTVVNAIGYIADIYMRYDDDAFRMGYGTHFEQMNGLAIINMFIIICMITRYRRDLYKHKKIRLLFFIGAFLLCAYGASYIALFLTLLFYSFSKFEIKNIIKISVLFGALFLVLQKTLPTTFGYYYNSISLMLNSEEFENNARKMKMFHETYNIIEKNPIRICTIGFGPGSYNGRVSTLLNDDRDNPFVSLFGYSMTPLYYNYIYPLWNSRTANTEENTDGGRNKPMSSFVSVLIEYGAIVFFLLWGVLIYKICCLRKLVKIKENATIIYFAAVFFCILCFAEQWLETNEFLYFSLFYTLFTGSKS